MAAIRPLGLISVIKAVITNSFKDQVDIDFKLVNRGGCTQKPHAEALKIVICAIDEQSTGVKGVMRRNLGL